MCNGGPAISGISDKETVMKKQREIAIPNSCWNKAGLYELVFVLLERDKAAPAAIRAWCQERIRLGKNTETDEQIKEALRCAAEMENSHK
jgi:hypothetical protein